MRVGVVVPIDSGFFLFKELLYGSNCRQHENYASQKTFITAGIAINIHLHAIKSHNMMASEAMLGHAQAIYL